MEVIKLRNWFWTISNNRGRHRHIADYKLIKYYTAKSRKVKNLLQF